MTYYIAMVFCFEEKYRVYRKVLYYTLVNGGITH